MADPTNPWANAANEAVGAVYKHYMSKPNPAEMAQTGLKNELMNAQIGTQGSQRENYDLKNEGLRMRNAAPSRISALMSEHLGAQEYNSRPQQMAQLSSTPSTPSTGGVSDALMAALVTQESAGNANALSPVGAGGLTQIMPATARDPGYGVQPLQGWDGVDTRTASEAEQMRFGREYLEAMKRQNGGDERLALAAYNAGQGAVEKYGGIPPYEETQNYVRKIGSNVDLQTGGVQQANYVPQQQVQQSPIGSAYGQMAPQMLEMAMQAAIENPAQAADVLQMFGGVANLPPEIMSNLQQGAGMNFANTEEGFDRDLNHVDPYTLTAGARRFDANNNQVAYAPPKQGGSGSSVTLADGTVIDIDGGAGGQTAIGKSATNTAQSQQIEGAKFNRMIDYTRQLATEDATNFGAMGYTKGKLQDTAMLLNGVSESLGYAAPEEAFRDIINKESQNPELSPETLQSLYDPRLNALQKASSLMVYQAASALASQSGRSVSDKDVKMFKDIVGEPQSFFMNQQKFMSNLDAMQDFLSLQQGVLTDATGGDVVGQEYRTPDPSRFGDNQQQGVTTNDIDLMDEAQLDAFLAGE